MKKLIWWSGTGAGIFLALTMAVSISTMRDAMESGSRSAEIWGYASMVIAFSVIFFAIRRYRDAHLGGIITFGQGLRIGLFITIIASIIYVVAWLVLSGWLYPDFMEDYAQHVMEQLQASGATEQEISAQQAKMNQFIEWYKNPVFKAGMTFIEPLPVGVILTILAALILKKSN